VECTPQGYGHPDGCSQCRRLARAGTGNSSGDGRKRLDEVDWQRETRIRTQLRRRGGEFCAESLAFPTTSLKPVVQPTAVKDSIAQAIKRTSQINAENIKVSANGTKVTIAQSRGSRGRCQGSNPPAVQPS
jgi:hypothetical protein